ncbi:MAG: tRNA pseudouridine(55) synthase TruB [Oscillospiraceae bacterium]|nr:tRNA pseudouridine(55) synthase TruB [Oscillospiraceae bacterium]
MNGILVVDKPADFTSFDVVAKLRGMLRERRMGHGGTLDPMATGVLPVFIGEATKFADLDPDRTKTYRASVRLGIKTDTGDVTGTVTAVGGARPAREQLERALADCVGERMQLPPMYSAVKVNGKKLYEYARAGREVERTPRPVTIYGAALTGWSPDEFSFEVRCSKGTYVRTLAEELCEGLGARGALSALCRTQSGSFSLGMAHTLGEVQLAAQTDAAGLLLPPASLFAGLRRAELSGEPLRLFLNGVRFEAARVCADARGGEEFAVFSEEKFLGLARCEGGLFVKTVHYNG